ncbi:MAG: hypothetical protein ABI120_02640 [Gemmatimonadaceae bacterium]
MNHRAEEFSLRHRDITLDRQWKTAKLNGDSASVATAVADKPLHFTANGLTWTPMLVPLRNGTPARPQQDTVDGNILPG